MSFFDTTEELREYVTINASLAYDRWHSNEQAAINTFFLPVFSQTLVDEMLSYKIETNPLKFDLFKLACAALGKFAMLKFMDYNEVQITDKGIVREEGTTSKTAYAQQVASVKAAFENDGFESFEVLLAYLETNKATFTNWTTSPGYGKADEQIISNGTDLDSSYKVKQPFRIFLLMCDSLKSAEELHIVPNFQATVVESLRKTRKADLTGEMKQLRNYVDQVIICHGLIEQLRMGTIQITSEGAKVVTTDYNQAKTTNIAPSFDLLQTSIPALTAKANQYLEIAKKYVVDHPSVFGSTPTEEVFIKTRLWF